MKYLKLIGAIIIAILIAITGYRIQELKKSADRKNATAADNLNSGISAKIAKGKKQNESANKKIDKGIELKKKLHEQMEELTKNENIEDVASDFNARRLRIQPGGADT